jgi:multiple sugar transport system substrate-binding protein
MRLRSRRTFITDVSGVTALALLASCGGLPTSGSGGDAAPTAISASRPAAQATSVATKTTVQLWGTWNAEDPEMMKKLVPAFEAANPGITVSYTEADTAPTTQASDKLVQAINAGTPPDADYFDRFIVTSWAAQGLLTDLTSYAAADKLTKDLFLKEAWDEATWAGKLYATPVATDFRMLYYNTAHFQEVGLDPAKPPASISELDLYAAKLTKKGDSGYSRLGFLPWAYQGWLYTWGWLWGGEFYDSAANKVTANDPKIVAALDWMTTYATRDGIAAVDSFVQPFHAGGGWASAEKHAFLNQQLSMVCEGDWEISNFQRLMKPEQFQAWDVAPLPQAPGGPRTSTWGGGWSVVVPRGARQTEASWKLARWWATDGQALYVQDLTRIPTLLSLFDVKNFPNADPRWKKFLSLRDVVRFRPNIPAGETLWTALATGADDAIHGKAQPKAILDAATLQANTELAKYGKVS